MQNRKNREVVAIDVTTARGAHEESLSMALAISDAYPTAKAHFDELGPLKSAELFPQPLHGLWCVLGAIGVQFCLSQTDSDLDRVAASTMCCDEMTRLVAAYFLMQEGCDTSSEKLQAFDQAKKAGKAQRAFVNLGMMIFQRAELQNIACAKLDAERRAKEAEGN